MSSAQAIGAPLADVLPCCDVRDITVPIPRCARRIQHLFASSSMTDFLTNCTASRQLGIRFVPASACARAWIGVQFCPPQRWLAIASDPSISLSLPAGTSARHPLHRPDGQARGWRATLSQACRMTRRAGRWRGCGSSDRMCTCDTRTVFCSFAACALCWRCAPGRAWRQAHCASADQPDEAPLGR